MRDLFRGDRPGVEGTSEYPKEYVPFFFTVERHVLYVQKLLPAPTTDEEFKDIYNTMRRRPDGRSMGLVHDIVWQSSCLGLGLHSYSQSEYEAIFRRLAGSARTWSTGPSSRNYIAYLRSQF